MSTTPQSLTDGLGPALSLAYTAGAGSWIWHSSGFSPFSSFFSPEGFLGYFMWLSLCTSRTSDTTAAGLSITYMVREAPVVSIPSVIIKRRGTALSIRRLSSESSGEIWPPYVLYNSINSPTSPLPTNIPPRSSKHFLVLLSGVMTFPYIAAPPVAVLSRCDIQKRCQNNKRK